MQQGDAPSQGRGDGDAKAAAARIREMTIDDVAPAFHLGERLFRSRDAPHHYRTWDDREVLDLFLGDPDLCLVAELEGRVVGFALGTTVTKRHSAWKYGHLIWLGVAPEVQRLGIAARLFRGFRDRASRDGVRMLLVDTESDNEPAMRFFAKMGFGRPEAHTYLFLNLASHRSAKSGEEGRRQDGRGRGADE